MKIAKASSELKGFTLVELLVVISIIAILSVIGMTIYTSVQTKSRDSRRKADINSIAEVMEVNYGKTIAGEYQSLAASMFSAGVIPQDPINTTAATTDSKCPTVCQYCVKQGATAQVAAACAATGIVVVAEGTSPAPKGGLTNPYWTVCANLEGGSFYCRSNVQ